MADEHGVVLRVASSTSFAVVGVVADASAAALLIARQDVRNWASQNPLVLMVITAVSVMAALLLINAYSRARKRAAARLSAVSADARELRRRIEELEAQLARPNDADTARWREFWADLGRDSKLYRWLKEEFYTSYAWEADLDELDRVYYKWKRDPVEYYDVELQQAYEKLRTALYKLKQATWANYWVDEEYGGEIGKRRLAFPSEWDYKRKDEATVEINGAWDELTDSYDKFVRTAMQKKLAESRN